MAATNYTTISRTKILEFLQTNKDKTVNVQDINHYLCDCDCKVNITTIYRYLDKLVADGAVMKYSDKNGTQAIFQYVGEASHCDEHLHLQCVKCGAVSHLDCPEMAEFADHIKSHHGFVLECRNSVIYGICKACSKKIRVKKNR